MKTLTLFHVIKSQAPGLHETSRACPLAGATQAEGPVVAIGREHSTLGVVLAQANQTSWVKFFEAKHTRISSLFVGPLVFEDGRLPSS